MSASEFRASYLDDLGRLLQPLTAVQRIEVVDGVRERISVASAALGHEPTGPEMSQILQDIGDVTDVAERALVNAPVVAPTEPAPTVAPTKEDRTAYLGLPPAARDREAGAQERATLSEIPAMQWPEEPAPRPSWTRRWIPLAYAGATVLGSFFLMFVAPIVLVAIGVFVLWSSPLWTSREKLIGTFAPAVLLGAFLPSLVALSTVDAVGRTSTPTVGLAVLAVLALAGAATAIWVAFRGLRAAAAVDAAQAAERRKP